MKVLSVGAVLWDIIENSEHIGGAPFNLCAHLLNMGADVEFLTRIGTDARADKTREIIASIGLSDRFLQTDKNFGTGIAEVSLDANRNASYNLPHAAYDEISAEDDVIKMVNDFAPDVLCFGTFEQRYPQSRRAIAALLAKTNPKEVFYDVNIRMDFMDKDIIENGLKSTTILKLNEGECEVLSEMFFSAKLSFEEFSKSINAKFNTHVIIITLGENGCYVWSTRASAIVPTKSLGLGDTVGAGDAFSAAFLRAYHETNDVLKAAECGNLLGAYVASKIGAFPEYDTEIKEKLTPFIAR